MKIELKPVYNKEEIVLYDVVIDGVWCGSARTKKRANVLIAWHTGKCKDIEIG